MCSRRLVDGKALATSTGCLHVGISELKRFRQPFFAEIYLCARYRSQTAFIDYYAYSLTFKFMIVILDFVRIVEDICETTAAHGFNAEPQSGVRGTRRHVLLDSLRGSLGQCYSHFVTAIFCLLPEGLLYINMVARNVHFHPCQSLFDDFSAQTVAFVHLVLDRRQHATQDIHLFLGNFRSIEQPYDFAHELGAVARANNGCSGPACAAMRYS